MKGMHNLVMRLINVGSRHPVGLEAEDAQDTDMLLL